MPTIAITGTVTRKIGIVIEKGGEEIRGARLDTGRKISE